MEAWVLEQLTEIKAIEVEVLGMVAENQIRLQQNESVAYPESAFQAKAAELRSVAALLNRYR